jgi:hypothetical protein
MEDTHRLKIWTRLSLINLLIVSVLGVLLRYKGAFYFPAVDYKYLLNAHSHFAFSGWVTTALFVALTYILVRSGVPLSRSYRYQFRLNQLASFGMLVSFMIQGYGPISIFFSALSVIFSYWFSIRYWLDIRKSRMPPPVTAAIRLALVFLVLSTAGPFLLAYSTSHGVRSTSFYYNSIYLYLHFQYNGWFSFGVLALLFWTLFAGSFPINKRLAVWTIGLMGAACVPAYCLSLLWTAPPLWIRVTAGTAALVQLSALLLLVSLLWKAFVAWRGRPSRLAVILWGLSFSALALKIVLQALSVIPTLGRFAFSFRPVIIAYLHLVLLAFVTFFLIGFFSAENMLDIRGPIKRAGLAAFITGVFANECILLLQSLMATRGIAWMSAPYFLFAAALCMFAGLLPLTTGRIK